MAGLYQGSCERMGELRDNSIDLIVTSPPYWVDLTDKHLQPALARTGRGTTLSQYRAYLDWLKTCLAECHRVLKPGCVCAVQVATTIVDKVMYPLPFHLVGLAESVGFCFHQDIVWNRWRGWDKRGGNMIKHPYPGYYTPNRVFEYILVFRKPGRRRIFEGRTPAERAANRVPIDSLFTREIDHNLWHIATVQPYSLLHPCPFPEELAYRLIMLYSYKGERVLDPFLGSGTTLKVARLTGRDYYGYEMQPAFLKLARQRLQEPTLHRQDWVCRFEHAATVTPRPKATHG